MFMLIPETSSSETNADQAPEQTSELSYEITRQTRIRIGRDSRQWKIHTAIRKPDCLNILLLIVRPYRCRMTSSKWVLKIVALPLVMPKILSERHHGYSYQDENGLSHLVIFTWKNLPQRSRLIAEEIYAA
jgi:hypothetical protein